MDIDIDIPSSFDRSIFPWARATVIRDGQMTSHPCGMHPQAIPVDPVSGLAAIPYEDAEDIGYFKIDFLHLGVYSFFQTRDEIDALLKKDPDWSLLLVQSNHAKLFQLANHGELLMKLKPKSLLDLADVLALIRPGKRQLVPLYQKDKDMARKLLWAKGDEGYSFKKSHALGYAYVVWLQLHLIEQGRL